MVESNSVKCRERVPSQTMLSVLLTFLNLEVFKSVPKISTFQQISFVSESSLYFGPFSVVTSLLTVLDVDPRKFDQ